MVGHAIQSIKGINEKIYSKEKQKQKANTLYYKYRSKFAFLVKCEHWKYKLKRKDIFKRKNPIDYIFSKNYKKIWRKEVRWKYSKIQSWLCGQEKNNLKYKFKRKDIFKTKRKSNRLYFF